MESIHDKMKDGSCHTHTRLALAATELKQRSSQSTSKLWLREGDRKRINTVIAAVMYNI